MRKTHLSGIALALALGTAPALGADNGIYLGASVGQSNVEDGSIDFDASATGFKGIVGWRFLDWLAVEGNYVDFGSGSDRIFDDKVEVSADGLSLSAIGFLPVGPVDLFARVGAFDWSGDIRSAELGRGSADGTDLTYGLGVQFRVWSLSLRAEYERYELDDVDADMISVGVTWTFF
jgi:OOP family OmpA-OmpF porin